MKWCANQCPNAKVNHMFGYWVKCRRCCWCLSKTVTVRTHLWTTSSDTHRHWVRTILTVFNALSTSSRAVYEVQKRIAYERICDGDKMKRTNIFITTTIIFMMKTETAKMLTFGHSTFVYVYMKLERRIVKNEMLRGCLYLNIAILHLYKSIYLEIPCDRIFTQYSQYF